MPLHRKVDVEIELSAQELAHAWWGLSSDEQVVFFNMLGSISSELPMQLEHVSQSSDLLGVGRDAMRLIGEYAEPATDTEIFNPVLEASKQAAEAMKAIAPQTENPSADLDDIEAESLAYEADTNSTGREADDNE